MCRRKLLTHFSLLLAAVLAAACAERPPSESIGTSNPAENQPAGVTIQGDDDALQRLVVRLLAPQYPGAPQAQGPTLVVGALPDDLPLELPLPEGATVLGGLSQKDGPYGIQIVLDAPRPAQEVIDFYTQAFTAQGLKQPEMPPMGQVFVPATPQSATFCRDDNSLAISVSTFEMEGGLTDVRLHLHTDTQSSVCQFRGGIMSGAQQLLPQLKLPQGAGMGRGSMGGGSSSGSAYSSADIQSDLSLAEISQHYAGQLKALGWEMIDEDQSGKTAWSAWTLPSEASDDGSQWIGTLLVMASPVDEKAYTSMVRVDLKK